MMGNLRIAVPNCAVPPYVFPCFLKSSSLWPNASACPLPGTNPEIIGEILHQLRVKATLIPIGCGSLVKDFQSSISNGTVDTCLLAVSLTIHRLRRFSFTYPLTFTERGYLTQKISIPPNRNFFEALSLETWLSVFSIVVVSMLFSLLRHKSLEKCNNTEIFWPIISLMTLHSDGTESQLKSSRALLIGSLGVMTLFVFNLYQSVLLKIMTSKRVVTPFKSTMDLSRLIAAGEKYLLISDNSSSYFTEVHNSPLPAFRSMKGALNRNPLVIETSTTLLGHRLSVDPRAAAVMYTNAATPLMAIHCNLIYQIDQALPRRTFSLIFRKNHSILAKLSVKVIENQRFIEHTLTKYRKRAVKLRDKICAFLKSSDPQPGDPLNVYSFQSVFHFILSGLCAGIVCFLFEKAWQSWKARNHWKIQREEEEEEHLPCDYCVHF